MNAYRLSCVIGFTMLRMASDLRRKSPVRCPTTRPILSPNMPPATAPIAVPIPGISDVPSIAPYSTPAMTPIAPVTFSVVCTAEILVTSAAVMVGMPIPLVPIQILLMNLLTDALPAMVLAVNPGSKTKETRQVDIVDKQLYRKVITRGVLLGLGSLGLFALTLASGAPVQVAQSVAFATCYHKQRPLDDKRAYLQDFFWRAFF